MTEKRFILTATDYIYDNQDKGICPTLESIVKLLNELHEENMNLQKENEQLASELVECKALIIMLSDTTVSGRIDNLIYSRYNFYSEDEYYEKLEEYKNKVIKELKE